MNKKEKFMVDRLKVYAGVQTMAFRLLGAEMIDCPELYTDEQKELVNLLLEQSMLQEANIEAIAKEIIYNHADRILFETGLNGMLDNLNKLHP